MFAMTTTAAAEVIDERRSIRQTLQRWVEKASIAKVRQPSTDT